MQRRRYLWARAIFLVLALLSSGAYQPVGAALFFVAYIVLVVLTPPKVEDSPERVMNQKQPRENLPAEARLKLLLDDGVITEKQYRQMRARHFGPSSDL